MKYSVVLAGIATTFATLSSASPVEARQATSFQVNGFSASCSGPPDQCVYAATVTSIPDGAVITATHTRTGVKTFPTASGFWTTNNTAINIRVNGLPQADKRIAIVDMRVVGSAFTYSHVSPAADWPVVDGYQKYTGPSSFATEFNQV
ncbi:hypothetical protein QBC43DRAFT_357604 [Cladorrhinum sp. PSN259]|nr:hypothetical protein QBC43DRAFT_357604 [Cladorrhinum sp. PSN259]